MKAACIKFLTDRLAELTARNGVTLPYRAVAFGELPANVFFDEMPLDFLKDNDWAACCLPLQDRTKKLGKTIAKELNAGKTEFTLTRRRFTRDILFRCFLYAPTAVELWGDADHVGLVDQLVQRIAEHKVFAAGDNSAIRVEPQDAARPWDTTVEMDRKLRRPRMAIIRVAFSGGVQVVKNQAAIRNVEITPSI
uniref:Uncharacterized protein n=1 Tax=Geobacter sp. (strain M21) TaxID=443144 RepID=C6E6Q7_GEOSM